MTAPHLGADDVPTISSPLGQVPTPGTRAADAGDAQSPLTPAVQALENATALDALTRLGDSVAGAITAGPFVTAALQGKWLGHALHPLLIEVPMGTWMSAAVLDLFGGDGAEDAARLLTGVGVASAVPAALTGWAEYRDAGQREKRVGVVHAGANGAAMMLQMGSFTARATGRHGLGRALGVGGMMLAGVAGYLGGHLVAARKVSSRDAAYGDTQVINPRL